MLYFWKRDKKMKKILILISAGLILFITILSCEKDDICPPEVLTTPHLIITFHDIINREERKAVPSLRIIGEDNNTRVNTFEDRVSAGLDSIALPLKVYSTTSSFIFISNSASEDDIETGNVDIVIFNYDNTEDFISRGCGYANTYENLVGTFEEGSDGERWIISLDVENSTVDNQNAAHVKIYH